MRALRRLQRKIEVNGARALLCGLSSLVTVRLLQPYMLMHMCMCTGPDRGSRMFPVNARAGARAGSGPGVRAGRRQLTEGGQKNNQMRATMCLLGSGTRRKEAGAVHQDTHTHTHTHAQWGRCAGLRRALPPCPTARSEGEAQREKLDLQRLRFSSLYIALCAAVWICSACALAVFYSIAPRIPPGRDISTSGSDARL